MIMIIYIGLGLCIYIIHNIRFQDGKDLLLNNYPFLAY